MDYKFIDVYRVCNTTRCILSNQCRHNDPFFTVIGFKEQVDSFLNKFLNNLQCPIGRPVVYNIQVFEPKQIPMIKYPFTNNVRFIFYHSEHFDAISNPGLRFAMDDPVL